MAVRWQLPMPLVIVLSVGIGMIFGSIIGLLRVTLRIPSFISSLALLTALRSGAFLLCGGFPISPLPSSFDFLGNGALGPMPVPVLVMLIIFVIGHIVLKETSWGRELYAVGGNEDSASCRVGGAANALAQLTSIGDRRGTRVADTISS